MRRRRPEPPLPRGVTLDPTFEVVPVSKAPTEPATPRTPREPTTGPRSGSGVSGSDCCCTCSCGCHR